MTRCPTGPPGPVTPTPPACWPACRARVAWSGRGSGYLQYVHRRTLVRHRAAGDAVIYLRYRPGHFLVQGHPYATVWPASAADQVARGLTRAHVTGPYRTLAQDVSFGIDQLVEICDPGASPAVNDTFTALTCIDWIGDSLCKVTGRWQPARVHRDAAGTVRVIATEPTYDRLVQRSFEKIRQSSPRQPRGADPPAGRAGQDHGTDRPRTISARCCSTRLP